MQENSKEFSEAMRLANSPAGQQLLAMLRQTDPEALKLAMAQASAGDYSQVKKTMNTLLSNPALRSLLEQLGRQSNG